MFKDKTGPWSQIFCCYNSFGRRKILHEEEWILEFFPSFWVFIYLCVRKHGYVRELGGVTSYNWGKSWITLCNRGTDLRHMSPLFLLNFPSFLVIYPVGLGGWAPREDKPQWRGSHVYQEGDGAFLDGGCLEAVMCAHHLLVETDQREWGGVLAQMIPRELVSCPGNKEELSVEERAWLGPHRRLLFQSQTLGCGRSLLIYLVSTS